MGFMCNNNVTVNCKKNYANDMLFTLVDNKHEVAHDFRTPTEILKYFKDEGFIFVNKYVDDLIEENLNGKKENRKLKTYTFFVNKCDVPYIINKIDSSEHVKDWRIHNYDRFESEGMVMMTYDADKQILHQEVDGVVIEL